MPQNITKNLQRIFPVSKRSAFGSLDIYPFNLRFATQNKNERIYIKVRAHIITNLGWLLRGFFIAAIPILAVLSLDFFELLFTETFKLPEIADFFAQFEVIIFSVPMGLWTIIFLLYYSFLVTFLLLNFLNWYFNIYLVTNERILHIYFRAFNGTHVSEAPLKNIEDISQRVSGFLPSIFHYGDVWIQTAAERGRFHLTSVPDPSWFRDTLADLARLVQMGEP